MTSSLLRAGLATIAVAVLLVGCAGEQEMVYLYGGAIMSEEERNAHREFLKTAESEELEAGIGAHKEKMDARAETLGIELVTEEQYREFLASEEARVDTGTRAGSSASRMEWYEPEDDRALREYGMGGTLGTPR